ncbi:MAG: FprA family A-type flavoprotein [Mahellales bacterium]|jgi:anaerobic nitric oxide reductase flavorubredoxin
MGAVKLSDNIYWVGAVDWNIRYFHGPAYTTHRGTTYNAYLIVDDKVTLVDTVYTPFADELIENIRQVIDPARIDYVVVNHIEMDHSGSLPAVMGLNPKARVFCSQKAVDGLKKHYFADWDFNVVKTGDRLNLGQNTLTFIEAPMLHWPDSMFTYIAEQSLLMPNDAFGQHLASSFRFDDQVEESVLMEEAAKYYANILTPFSRLVLKKIDEVVKMGIDIKVIAPSHGVIWRKDPTKIIDAYVKWASGQADKKAIIVYDTMWGSTEKMAHSIGQGIASQGIEYKLFKISKSDRNDIIKEIQNAKAVVIGSPVINRDILPTLSPLLDDIKGLRPVDKVGVAFGSYGWSGGAVESIQQELKQAGIDIIEDGLGIRWVPDDKETQACVELGKRIAQRIKG